MVLMMSYSFVLAHPPGGGDEDEIYTDKLVGHDISIYPNPTDGDLKIEITNLNPDITARIEIFDINGNQVFKLEKVEAINILDLNEFTNGTYFMKIFIAEKFSVWKLIKKN